MSSEESRILADKDDVFDEAPRPSMAGSRLSVLPSRLSIARLRMPRTNDTPTTDSSLMSTPNIPSSSTKIHSSVKPNDAVGSTISATTTATSATNTHRTNRIMRTHTSPSPYASTPLLTPYSAKNWSLGRVESTTQSSPSARSTLLPSPRFRENPSTLWSRVFTYMEQDTADSKEDTSLRNLMVGISLLVLTLTYAFFHLFTIVLSKVLWKTPTGFQFLDWIREDRYYCYLIPITGPLMCYFVLINWLGMKYFKQNA